MLCTTCRLRLLARLPIFRNHIPFSSPSTTTTTIRTIATAPSTPNAAPINPPPPSSSTEPPSALSFSSTPAKSQPLSTPGAASSATATGKGKGPTTATSKARKIRSSIAGGAELRGLGYTKAKPQILAKEDEEYPDWLWGLLDSNTAGEVDMSALTKKQKAKQTRKQSKLLNSQSNSNSRGSDIYSPPIPLHEQSKDLTTENDDAVTSLERRGEIVRSSRVARRKGIREDNFLRGL